MGQLRIAGSSGSVQFQATNTSSSQTLEAPDASGTIALLPTASGETGAYLARNATASEAERTANEVITFSEGITITGNGVGSQPGSIYSTTTSVNIRGQSSSPVTLGYSASGAEIGVLLTSTSGVSKNFAAIQVNFQTAGTGDYSYTGLNLVPNTAPIGEITSASGVYLGTAQTANSLARNFYGYFSGVTINSATRSDGLSSENWNFYAAGDAPNYFKGVVRCGNPTSPSAGEIPDQNYLWTTQSNASNATRLTYGFLSVSSYSTDKSTPLLTLNRLGSDEGDFIHFIEDGVLKDTIRLDGSGGITYGTSDYRLKENIVDLPSATDTIKSLRPVNFNFTSHPGKTRPGFIAHEVSETLPVAVTGEKDATEAIGTLADYNGKVLETNVPEPDELEYTEESTDEYGVSTQTVRTRTWTATGTRPVYQGVDQTKLIPLITKALQEALDRIEQLESNTLQPLYATLADLPSATDHHGKVAHVHSEGALYFAHAGNWVKLQNA